MRHFEATKITVEDEKFFFRPNVRHRIAALRPRFEAGLDPIEVAKVILKAATSENPDLRYVVGDDAQF
ncbi:MAG TPA: hypothetical protein VFS97_04235 [Nitrososphaeraceae archaeon]|nr:hypothetical protein [Nitrososphaeraceae archaeon]